jgi:hypothetical protein
MGYVSHVVHFHASKARNIDVPFFMLRCARCSFHKKRAGTHYVKHVLLHPVGSICHIVYSGVSRARNVNTLFFMLAWDWYGFNKKLTRTHYAKFVFCIRWDQQVT